MRTNVILAAFFFATQVWAQFTGNNQTNTISGVTSNWTGSYYVGSNYVFDALLIQNGAALTNFGGYIGYTPAASNNVAVVSRTGSVWNATGDVMIGVAGSSNRLVVSNGGRVTSVNGYIGLNVSAKNNSALVTGTGAIWSNRYNLYLGYSSGSDGNSLIVSNGGEVVAGVTVGIRPFSGAQVRLTIDGGTLTANHSLELIGSTTRLFFNAGQINSAGTFVTNTQQFVVGNGIGSANFHLLDGTHSFNNGLRISSNSFLTGCGAINGIVAIDAGGSVRVDCGGGSLWFNTGLTNNGIIHVQNGSVLFAFGLVNNGIIDLTDGTAYITGLINNGTIVNASDLRVTSITQEGDDIRISWPTLGGRTYVVQSSPTLGGFTDLSPAIVIPGASLSTTTYLDLGGATNAPSRFYRIRLAP